MPIEPLQQSNIPEKIRVELECYLEATFNLDRAALSKKLTEDFQFDARITDWMHRYFREEFRSVLRRAPLLKEIDTNFTTQFVFIAGSPRSGTTILQRILLEHPSIGGVFEESRLFLRDLTDKQIVGVLRDWESQATSSDKPVVLEKSPLNMNNWYRIFTLLPKAKIVFCLRDGRESVISQYEMFNLLPERGAGLWLYEIGQYEIAKRAFPDNVYLVYLRDLQSNPKETLDAVLKYIGAESSPAILSLLLSYHERPRSLEPPYQIDLNAANLPAPPKNAGGLAYQRWQANLPLQVMTHDWQGAFSEGQYPELHAEMRDTLIKYGFIDGSID